MKLFKVFAALLAVLTLGIGLASAQSDRGTIRGTVTDPNNAIVSNATVTLTSLENNETRQVTTSDNGIFVFPEVKAGLYRVGVEASGFKRTSVENVKVDVQGTQSLEIKLEIGEVSGNVVNVEAVAVAINSDTPVRQTTVTERQVRELPLAVSSESGGRTPLAFIFLDSNVNASQTGGGTNASSFKVSGGQAQGTEILVDGASTRRQQNGTFFTEVGPGPNAYREFTISTSSFSAEFGNSSGGIVNFTLKSGTNQFHGEGYDLVRNEVLDANSLYNKARGLERNRDNQNNFGFNVGGPIYIPNFGEGNPGGFFRSLKNRAFFFFNYEGYRFKQGVNGFVTVPTLRMRNGDFGELLSDPAILRQFPGGIHIYNPRIPSSQRLMPLANNIVPANLIDPIGLRLINSFPTPNRPGAFENYQFSSILPNDANQYTVKTDFDLTSAQHLTFSYSHRLNTRIASQNGSTVVFTSPVPNLDVWQQSFASDLGRIQHDFTITPTLLNHLNIGYSYFNVANRNLTDPFNTSSLGFNPNSTQNITFPVIDFPGYGGIGSSDVRRIQGIGSTFFTDRLRDATLELSDNLTWIAGRHSIKFGGDVRISQFNVRQYLYGGGQFNFRADQTASDIDPGGGYPLAGLITGATEFSFNSNTTIEPAYRQLGQSYFVQDDYKLTRKLTLNLGLRYDLPGLRTEAHDRYRGFDPNITNPVTGTKGAIVGAGGQSGLQAQYRSLARPDKSNIGPRLGAAYALGNRTVIRGGIGLYYSPVLLGNGGQQAELQTGTIGYNSQSVYTPAGDRNSTQFLSTFHPIPTSNPNDQFVGNTGLSSFYYFDPNFRSGRTLQFSVDVQRELPFNLVASIGYIGNRGDHLRSNFSRINALPLNALKLGNDILSAQFYRIDPTDPGYDPTFATAVRTVAQSAGVALPANRNAVYPGFGGGNTIAQALRPFPQYGDINNILESKGVSNYNALQLKIDRRFAQGLQFGSSYTYSRLITNASENLLGDSPLNGVLQNPYDTSSLKTDSPTHSRHVFVTNFLYELPLGKGKAFLNRGGIVDRIFGGFQVSGIFRYQSGTPLAISLGDPSGFLRLAGFNGNLRPNLTGQPIFLNNQTAAGVGLIRVLNPAAFTAPKDFGAVRLFNCTGPNNTNCVFNTAYQSYYSDPTQFFGTAPPVLNDARSPMYFDENLNILKKTRITETVTFEIGAEFFNIFNRVRYLPPDVGLGNYLGNGNFGNGNFGVIGAVDNPRVIQLRGRIIF